MSTEDPLRQVPPMEHSQQDSSVSEQAETIDATGNESSSFNVSLLKQLEEAQAQAQENWEKLLRAKADLDNQRKRSARELENAHKYALEQFANALLPIKDSLEMGIDAASGEVSVDKLREGSEMILRMFTQTLEKHGITEINPQGERFNPDLHQAVSVQENAELDPNTVTIVMQKGYVLNDRLLRPAMVVVSKASS